MARIRIEEINPTKIVMVGLNYREHAKELGMEIPKEPIIFLKPTSALVYNQGQIIYPDSATRVDYEAELAVVISKSAKDLEVSEVKDYVLGYTCLNDVTERDIQKKDGQWTRAKSYDTFCPVGPWIETNIKNPDDLEIRLLLNGKSMQHANTSDFIFSTYELISFISKVMTLNPGDIISTGTPHGIGELKSGDNVVVEIEGIGRLENTVIKNCFSD